MNDTNIFCSLLLACALADHCCQ